MLVQLTIADSSIQRSVRRQTPNFNEENGECSFQSFTFTSKSDSHSGDVTKDPSFSHPRIQTPELNHFLFAIRDPSKFNLQDRFRTSPRARRYRPPRAPLYFQRLTQPLPQLVERSILSP